MIEVQENDTAIHVRDLSTMIPPETKALLLQPKLEAGAGDFLVYPLSHTVPLTLSVDRINIVTIKNRELKWANTVANDYWKIWTFGYFVQKRTR